MEEFSKNVFSENLHKNTVVFHSKEPSSPNPESSMNSSACRRGQQPDITITSDRIEVSIKIRDRENNQSSKPMDEVIVPDLETPKDLHHQQHCRSEDADMLTREEEPLEESFGVDVRQDDNGNDDEGEAYVGEDPLSTRNDTTNVDNVISNDVKPFSMPETGQNSAQGQVSSSSQLMPEDVMRKVLRCELCPQMKLTNLKESFGHHQNEHGLKFCPVCFVLVNCHDDFLKEHLRAIHSATESGDINCPLCSISINCILCFDHIVKDHLREFFDETEWLSRPQQPLFQMESVSGGRYHFLHPNSKVEDDDAYFGPPPTLQKMQPFYVRSGCESISRVNNGKKINYNFKRNTVGTRPYNVRGRNTSYVFKPPPRHKHKLDPESLKILDAFFQQNRHPTVVEKMELANKCGLPSQTVTNWFCNRRKHRVEWDKLSEMKKRTLVDAFKRNPRPLPDEFIALAQTLGLHRTAISTWFKDRIESSQKHHPSMKRELSETATNKRLKEASSSSESESISSNAASAHAGAANTSRACAGVDPPQPLTISDRFAKVQDWIDRCHEKPCTTSHSTISEDCDTEIIPSCSSASPTSSMAAFEQRQPHKHLTHHDKTVLENLFKTQQYLSAEEKDKLARQLRTTRDRISNWFQLSRAKLKGFLNSNHLNKETRTDLLDKHIEKENVSLEDVFERYRSFVANANQDCFSRTQEIKLTRSFEKNMHPDAKELTAISEEIRGSYEKVSVWFANRFQRLRRGKLPGYDLKEGNLVKLGVEETYAEIKTELRELQSPTKVRHNTKDTQSLSCHQREVAITSSQDLKARAELQAKCTTTTSDICHNQSKSIEETKRLVVILERLPFLPGTIVRIKDIESLDEGSEKDADVTGCDPAKKRRRLRQEEEVDVVCVTSIDKISGKEILTDTQKAALKTSFEKDDHPDVEGVLTLSKKLHLTQEQVDNWFNYHRNLQRHKVDMTQKRPSPAIVVPSTTTTTTTRSQKNEVTSKHKTFLPDQRAVLTEFYERCRYPTQKDREELSKQSGLNEVQIDQWFRQQRHKRNASIRTVVKNEIDGCGEPAHSYSTRSRDASNQLEDSGISSASGTGSRSNFPRATSRVVTSPHYSQQINNVKLENIDVGNSHNTANNTQLSWIKTEPHLSKNLKEPSEYQRTYLNRSSRRGFASKCDQVKTEPVSPTKVSVKQEKVEKRYYFKTNVEIPAILCERFYAIRELGLPLFRKKINQLCLNFEELVEFYITCDEESQKVIREESQLLSGIIEFHEQSGLAFTADQEDYMVERGLQILNKLLRSRPSDKNWCAAVNNFHVENVFRSWHFVAVYAYLSQVSMVDGITDFCSKLHVLKEVRYPKQWLIPPVLQTIVL